MKKNLKRKLELLKMNKIQLICKINTLELEKKKKETIFRNELFIIIMRKAELSQMLQSCKEENKKLRLENKMLRNSLRCENDRKRK